MTSPLQAGAGPKDGAFHPPIARSPAAAPSSPAQVLAALLDLQGSVDLAHRLRSRSPASERGPAFAAPRGHAPLLLGDYVRKQLDAIERSFIARGARRLPTAADLHPRLAPSAPFDSRESQRAAGAGIARVYRDHALAALTRGRDDVAALRDDVAHDLRALGPDAVRLEMLDGALRAATRTAIASLLERLAAALESALADRLVDAVAALAAEPSVSEIEGWLAPAGPIAAHLARVNDMARALFRRDAARLVALVDAACKGGA